MSLVAEFWVVRVVVRAPWKSNCIMPAAVMARVRSGDYCIMPAGYIGEPIAVFDSQAKATERAFVEASRNPEQEYRVVMNADPEDLAKSPEAASS